MQCSVLSFISDRNSGDGLPGDNYYHNDDAQMTILSQPTNLIGNGLYPGRSSSPKISHGIPARPSASRRIDWMGSFIDVGACSMHLTEPRFCLASTDIQLQLTFALLGSEAFPALLSSVLHYSNSSSYKSVPPCRSPSSVPRLLRS